MCMAVLPVDMPVQCLGRSEERDGFPGAACKNSTRLTPELSPQYWSPLLCFLIIFFCVYRRSPFPSSFVSQLGYLFGMNDLAFFTLVCYLIRFQTAKSPGWPQTLTAILLSETQKFRLTNLRCHTQPLFRSLCGFLIKLNYLQLSFKRTTEEADAGR